LKVGLSLQWRYFSVFKLIDGRMGIFEFLHVIDFSNQKYHFGVSLDLFWHLFHVSVVYVQNRTLIWLRWLFFLLLLLFLFLLIFFFFFFSSLSWFLCSAMQYFKLASHLFFVFNLVLHLLISICFIWNNLWKLKFISILFSFDLFYSSDLVLILILLVVIYVIWNNFYNFFFDNFIFYFFSYQILCSFFLIFLLFCQIF